jgi:hypothetical protein
MKLFAMFLLTGSLVWPLAAVAAAPAAPAATPTAPAAPVPAADPSLSAQANAAYLAANAKKPGIIIKPDGLQIRIVQSGFGRRPAAADSVEVYYTGALINGAIIGSWLSRLRSAMAHAARARPFRRTKPWCSI